MLFRIETHPTWCGSNCLSVGLTSVKYRPVQIPLLSPLYEFGEFVPGFALGFQSHRQIFFSFNRSNRSESHD